jgi:hypothetical protein
VAAQYAKFSNLAVILLGPIVQSLKVSSLSVRASLTHWLSYRSEQVVKSSQASMLASKDRLGLAFDILKVLSASTVFPETKFPHVNHTYFHQSLRSDQINPD